MVRHPALCAGARVGLSRPAGGVRIREEMELRAAEPEPRSVEDEVRRTRHLLEAQRVGVEAPRAPEIGYDEPDVLDLHGHDAYRIPQRDTA